MRTILIVGGSKGIGAALLNALVAHSKVINFSRTAPSVTHENLQHFSLDVHQDDLPELEQLDGFVYCPGSINLKPFQRLKLEDFTSDFSINVLGAVRVIQQYLAILKKGTHPSIVLFSSVATSLGMPFHASIAASKSAVEGLTKSLGAELAPTVRVNAIAPTVTDTSLAEKILRNDAMKEKIVERHPLKKYLVPQEVADMAAFLLSTKSLAISGQTFELDCGIVNFKL